MYTFIDESGLFIPSNSDKEIISTVGALIIPHDSYDSVIERFKKLKAKWGITVEIKGSCLKENQVDEIVQILETHDAIFIAVSVNSILQKPEVIQWHKKKCQEHILRQISEYHHPNLVNQLKCLSTNVSSLSNQLYVQYQLMNTLVYNAHQLSTLYYVQCTPSELGRFKWVIDAKEKNITKAEKWWHDTLIPTIQGMSVKKPFIMLKGADYSNYKKFDFEEDPFKGSINKIMKDLQFLDSKNCDGLQLADIVTTALNKSLNNKFGILGWYRIGRIMITQYEPYIIFLLSFDKQESFLKNDHLKFVIKKLRKAAKRAVT